MALETLSIRGLARTRVGKSVLDAGWGILIRLIGEKAVRKGRRIIRVGRWEPTSQRCSHCGLTSGRKKLDVRKWECPHCHTPLDRDYNAAVNIMNIAAQGPHPVAAGPAETQNGRGGSVRQSRDGLRAGATAFPRETTTPSTSPSI